LYPYNTLPTGAYQIKAGDFPWELAQQFNSNILWICAANLGNDINRLPISQPINISSPNKFETNRYYIEASK